MSKFPQIMGILNVTPDSFSDGGVNFSMESAVESALKMLDAGADIIDIGGESTRPGAKSVPANEQINRIMPPIKEILTLRPDAIISVDTTNYQVAKTALDAGAKIINDISGLQFEPKLAELVTEYDAELVIMHTSGNSEIMQSKTNYDNLIDDILQFLTEKVSFARAAGASKIIIDYGIGFGKTPEQNIELLKNTEKFIIPGTKILVGLSRKSFIGKILNIDYPKDRDLASILFHTLLLNKPIDIIRVHSTSEYFILKKIHEILKF